MNNNLEKNKYLISLVIIVIVVIILLLIYYQNESKKNTLNKNDEKFEDINLIHRQISNDDSKYFSKFISSNQIFSKLIDKNLLDKPIKKKNKILFITFDNRKAEYINIHNNNLQKYANKFNYFYKFLTECRHNVYWCKIQLVLEELLTNNYDYVIWLDSDTVIKNMDIDIGEILNKYNSDIFVGSDNMIKFDLVNAGIFVIKNSVSGIEFLKDCIGNVKHICFNDDGSLKGIWAGTCYEQGQMNIMIADKYYNKTTVLPNNIFLNYSQCVDNTFIMHLYASNDHKRKACFEKNI